MIYIFTSILLPFIISCVTYYIIHRKETRPIIYQMESDHWNDINETPVPDNFRIIWVTDGETVDWEYNRKYNQKGQLVMCSFEQKVITHWMLTPEPPKKGKIK